MRQSCAADGGTLTTQMGTQCMCTSKSTVYPTGIDELLLSFSHSYSTTTAVGMLEGSSAVTGEGSLDTILVDVGGSQIQVFPSGETISMSVKNWLAVAKVDLDQDNYAVKSFDIDDGSVPKMRTTGVTVYINLDYTNRRQGASNPDFVTSVERYVYATMSVRADKTQWASLGAQTDYLQYPTGSIGRQSYHKIVRYTQVVSFRFRGMGQVYALDWLYLLNALLSGVVLLGVAKTITSIIAKWLYYDRTICKMIRNKAMERLAVGTHLAELGVKAAAYAATFNSLDDDSDGYIDVKDIVKSLKDTKYEIADSKLHAIALLVIKRSSLLLKRKDNAPDRMDYAEFMSCMEGGAALDIEEFTGMVTSPATRWASWSMPNFLYSVSRSASPARKRSVAGRMAGVESFEAEEGEGRRLA